jgi:carbon storage regulator
VASYTTGNYIIKEVATMLILSRHKDEFIDLFVDGVKIAEILISEIRGDKVRIGIQAPKNVDIHRREVAVKALPNAMRQFSQFALELPTLEST